jgi:hypothetical protein
MKAIVNYVSNTDGRSPNYKKYLVKDIRKDNEIIEFFHILTLNHSFCIFWTFSNSFLSTAYIKQF